MTSARKACLIRFLFWLMFAFAIKEYPTQFLLEDFLAILAMFEVLIAISPFLDDKEPKQ